MAEYSQRDIGRNKAVRKCLTLLNINSKLEESIQKAQCVLLKCKLNKGKGPAIKINFKPIEREENFKYLRVILGEKLNCRQHTEQTVSTANTITHKITPIANKDLRISL